MDTTEKKDLGYITLDVSADPPKSIGLDFYDQNISEYIRRKAQKELLNWTKEE